jgi:hypothetical protein
MFWKLSRIVERRPSSPPSVHVADEKVNAVNTSVRSDRGLLQQEVMEYLYDRLSQLDWKCGHAVFLRQIHSTTSHGWAKWEPTESADLLQRAEADKNSVKLITVDGTWVYVYDRNMSYLVRVGRASRRNCTYAYTCKLIFIMRVVPC